MSKNEYVKFGTKRVRERKLAAGDELRTPDGIFYVREASVVPIDEEFTRNGYGEGYWRSSPIDVTKIRAVGASAPALITPEPSAWHRFLVWLGIEPKIPVAKVVERS